MSHSCSQPPKRSWAVIMLFLEQAEQVTLNTYVLFWKRKKKKKSASCVLSHKVNKAMIKEDKGRHGHLRCYFQETSGSD